MASSYPQPSQIPTQPPSPAYETPTYNAGFQQPPRAAGKGYVTLILIGIAILLIGGIIGASAGFLDDPVRPDSDDFEDYSDYEKAIKKYNEKSEEYKDNTRQINTIGEIVKYIGLIGFAFGMVLGSFKDRELSPNTRLGMLVAMAIVIGFKISGSILYYWL